jgi:hypothetical protein
MMVDSAETQARNGIGSIRQINGLNGNGAVGTVHELEGPALTQSVAALTQRHNVAEKSADSGSPGERLEADLESTRRRLQQLIGERNRLTTLLAERDAQLQRLNRELGALTERTKPAVRRSPGLLKTARTIFEKVRPLPAPGCTRSRGAQPETAERASAAEALVPWARNGPPKAVLAVVVFGLSHAEIENVLVAIEAHCAERDLAPLLLTDNDAFQVFRGRRVLFEFLPARSDQERLAPDLDWRLYTLRRLALIRRKWQPIRVVAFGRQAAGVVKLWRDSPFEATSIPAALSASASAAELAWRPAQPSAW